MKHVFSLVAAACVLSVVSLYYAQVFSYDVPEAAAVALTLPVFTIVPFAELTISAKAYAIFDIETGEVLLEHNSHQVYPIASVTKLFTATAILESFDPESTTTVTLGAIVGGGAAGKLAPKQIYTYRELLFPLILESSNDAAVVLDHATGGTLLLAMTEAAKKYGTTHTTFADASGLSAKNVSTVADLAAFSRAVGDIYPFIYDMAALPQYIGTYTGWRNNNPVFDTGAYRGGKHGYTPEAGQTLVARFDEEFAAGKRTLGYIVLGSSDLRADIAALRAFTHRSVEFK